MAREMTGDEWRAFVSHGTRTGMLATTRKDGRPHVMPVWFVLDGDDIVFMTGADTVKGRNLRRERRAALAVDDAAPPYSFVMVQGPVTLSEEPEEMLRYSIEIGARYMGADRAREFGERNAVPGELLVRLHAERVRAEAGLAD
jgi:PPOX class probable F420-dependent enzyme